MNQGDYFACECKGTDGNVAADVTWYKDNTKIGDTGKQKAVLVRSNVSRDDNGTYRCEAKSHERARNEKLVDLFVISKYYIDSQVEPGFKHATRLICYSVKPIKIYLQKLGKT